MLKKLYMSTNAAKIYLGEAPVGKVKARKAWDNDASAISKNGVTSIFSSKATQISSTTTRHTPVKDTDQHKEHLDQHELNPWVKSTHQKIMEKLSRGKIGAALDLLTDAISNSRESGIILASDLVDTLEQKGYNDLAAFVKMTAYDETGVSIFASSLDGLSSPASTAAQEELFTGDPRFVCEDYRAKEMQATQQAYEEHLRRKMQFPTLVPFNGRG
jgi:flagellar hook-associated protein FlgK